MYAGVVLMNEAYQKYVNPTVRTAWLQEWTGGFLRKLDEISDMGKEEIKSCCEDYKKKYIEEIKVRSELRAKKRGKELQETSWMNSAANNLSQVRNAIKLWQEDIILDESNSYFQVTKDGEVYQHLALLVMNFDSEFHHKRMAPTEEKKQAQRRNLVNIRNVDEYQRAIEKLLSSEDWKSVAVGLMAATGRRAGEILKSGEFRQLGQFEIEFIGQLKSKDKERNGYATFTLVESYKVCDGLLRLRGMPEIKELEDKTLAQVDSGCNNSINRVVVEVFSGIIEPPVGELQLSTKNLRASYSAIAIYLFCPWKQSTSSFISDRLGHTSDATASNYEDYQVVDSDGKPLTRGAWVERIGEEVQSSREELAEIIVVTASVREKLDDESFLPYPDITSRMEELIRLAEIGKKYESGELVTEVRAPMGREKKKPCIKDLETMTFDELKGTKVSGSSDEKIRRAVAALKEHNLKCGGDKRSQWAINVRAIKDLTNCRTAVVDSYLRSEEGIEELGVRFEQDKEGRLRPVIGYNEMAGFSLQQNRGKGNIREIIKID